MASLLLWAWRPWGADTDARRFAPAIAVAFAWVLARTLHAEWPDWPPPTSADWIPYLALAAGVAGALCTRVWLAWLAAAVAAAGPAWFMTRRALENEAIAPWFVILAVAVLLLSALSWQSLARRRPGPGFALALVLTCTASALALERGVSIAGAEQAGMLAACFGAATLLAFVRPDRARLESAVAPAVAILGALLLNGHLYAEMPWFVALLLIAAPSAAWAGRFSKRPWLRFTLATAAVAIVLTAAVALAAEHAPPPNPYESYGG